jgi:hypothetical protein
MSDDILAAYQPPTTLLQAVNLVLGAIGQVPVASLESSDSNVAAESALNRIGEVLRETLEEGWHFNTLPAFSIMPNASGEIVVPPNTLRAEQAYFPGSWDYDLVQHGQKMFDRKKATYTIGIPVNLNLTLNLTYETCPAACRWYIALRAARRAAAGTLLSSTAVQFTKSDEDIARLRWEQADSDTAARNLMSNPHIRRMRRR